MTETANRKGEKPEAALRGERVIAPLSGKTARIPFDALVEELGLKGAIQFIGRIKKNYGDSVLELREKTGKLTVEEVEKRIRASRK